MDGTDNLDETMGGSGDPGMKESPVEGMETESAWDDTAGAKGTEAATAAAAEPGTDANNTKAATWTNQLSKGLRGNAEAFSKVAGFKSVTELAEAFVKAAMPPAEATQPATITDEDYRKWAGIPAPDEPYGVEVGEELGDFLDKARAVNLSKKQAAKMADAFKSLMAERINRNVEKTRQAFPAISGKLIGEFGSEAAAYFRKAEKGLGQSLKESEFGANPQIARALVLLGKEMSEESTPGGRAGTSSREPKTLNEGARIF